MRYACLKHAAEPVCSEDQGNWCVWQEDTKDGRGHCELHFDDADFVHFLMWSGTGLACVGSKVSQIIQCSFGVSPGQCKELPAGCDWTEGACYPGWYGKIITKAAILTAFKKQVSWLPPRLLSWQLCH